MGKRLADVLEKLAYIIGFLIALWLAIHLWGWIVRNWQNMNEPSNYYCQRLKKIQKVDPIFEDNGKYEDESYRVTYDDSTTGLIDQAQLDSGYYCVSEAYMKDKDAKNRGWVLKP